MLSKEKRIIERWLETGLLQNIPEYAVEDCAFVLENQIAYNATDKLGSPAFKRLSIPLCRRIMDSLRLNNNVKSRLVEDNKFDQWFDTRLKFEPAQGKHVFVLDAEAQYCADFARSLVSRINEYMIATNRYEKKPFNFLGLGIKDGNVVVFHS